MAFSDLCHINNAYKTVENEVDQSERIMEENSMVRDLITKILDETGPADGNSSVQTPEKTMSGLPTNTAQFPKNDTGTSFIPPPYNNFHDNMYNFGQNEPNGFNFNLQNGFGNSNGFVNYPDNDINPLLGVDTVDTSSEVTPEQLNLLRLAAQEIGGAQFTSPNKFDEKYYNFFEPNQRNSLPEMNILTNNFNRPNSLHLDMSYNSNFDNTFNNMQRYSNSNKFDNTFVKEQDPTDILSYLNQLNISLDRPRDDLTQNMDFKMPLDLNGPYPNEDFNKMQDERSKMFYNRNFQQMPPKNYNGDNFYFNDVMKMNDRSPMGQNYDFSNQTPVSAPNSMNYKPNGFHQNDFMQRRDMNQMMPRDNYQGNGPINGQRPFDNPMGRDNIQQAVLMRQNQEFARQMGLLMRNRQPPNQLNIDVSFLHENTPFNLGLGALLGPSPPVQPPVLPSPMLDLPLLAPFYAMRNMRGAATASGILHARLDACYEQWRQLERERKRTEARLALAYPGRAVSSSNSIPVPRLPPCPTRVDRLTVDMLREHTKVLTLMGKMETLRASVCVAQNKKANKPEDGKITVLKRGQENVPNEKEKDKDGMDPTTFDPSAWREDVKNLAEIAPHSEVESAMLSWRNAVAAVQAARRRELAHAHAPAPASAPAPPATAPVPAPADPILQLAEAVKQLCSSARRARCAMWCDLTLTVALAPRRERPAPSATSATSVTSATSAPAATPADTRPEDAASDKAQSTPATQTTQDSLNTKSSNSKQSNNEAKEEKTSNDTAATKSENKNDNKPTTSSKGGEKQEKSQQRRSQNYRHKVNQRNDFYQKNQRYDNRFMQNRHPYYLATGPIN